MPSHSFYFSTAGGGVGCLFAAKTKISPARSICVWITLSEHTGTRALHSHTDATSASHMAARQACTCRRICDCNQINWLVPPWKRHVSGAHDKRRASGSFQLDAAYTNQGPGSRRRGRRGHGTLADISISFMAYMFEKLLRPHSA